MIEDTELGDIIEKLDLAIPKEGAKVKLTQYGGGPDEGKVIANSRGYLRLGVELLKGAFAYFEKDGKGEQTKQIGLDIDYLISNDSDINFDWFERRDDFADQQFERSWWQDHVVPWVILLVLVVFWF